MKYAEKEAEQLALIKMIREIDLTKDTLETVAASLLFHLFEGNKSKILKFVELLEEEVKVI